MSVSAKVLEGACLALIIKQSCRYHNGSGYEHHPAFIYEVHTGDSDSKYPDALDLKMLDAQGSTSEAMSVAQQYILSTMGKIIAELIEGEFNGSL